MTGRPGGPVKLGMRREERWNSVTKMWRAMRAKRRKREDVTGAVRKEERKKLTVRSIIAVDQGGGELVGNLVVCLLYVGGVVDRRE